MCYRNKIGICPPGETSTGQLESPSLLTPTAASPQLAVSKSCLTPDFEDVMRLKLGRMTELGPEDCCDSANEDSEQLEPTSLAFWSCGLLLFCLQVCATPIRHVLPSPPPGYSLHSPSPNYETKIKLLSSFLSLFSVTFFSLLSVRSCIICMQCIF